MNRSQQNFQIPKKQGGLYSLQLGQNYGPYLPKDINMNNSKSQKLLMMTTFNNRRIFQATGQSFFSQTRQPLQQSLAIYDEKIQNFTNYDEKYKAQLNAAENLHSNSNLQNSVLTNLNDKLKDYKTEIQEYKNSLQQMNEDIVNQNNQNIYDLQPIFKTFHQNLKTKLNDERNENYRLQREMEQILREKQQIQQQIQYHTNRTQQLEKIVGIKEIKDDMINSFDQQDIVFEDQNEQENSEQYYDLE